MSSFQFLVGSVNTSQLFTLTFICPVKQKLGSLQIKHVSKALGPHPWLHLQTIRNKQILYATGWTNSPGLVAYNVTSPVDIQPINHVETATRVGYVCASNRFIYYAGGATGGVLGIDTSTGGFSISPSPDPTLKHAGSLQELDFLESSSTQRDDGSAMDFGGLRYGAHSADLSGDGRALFIADIGRNCIWSYSVDLTTGMLGPRNKQSSPRADGGPRHTQPHPGGEYLYCVEEHSCMVDVYKIGDDNVSLTHTQGVKAIPAGENAELYWADEVRASLSNGEKPEYLYVSTRGRESDPTKAEFRRGWIAVFGLREDGMINDPIGHGGLLCMWQTPTSGGWENAIQPGPTVDGAEYIALTDTEKGQVMVISWDGKDLDEVARVELDDGAKGATAIWLS